MSKFPSMGQLKRAAQAAHLYTANKVAELANAVANTVGEVTEQLTAHADDATAHVSREDREKWNRGGGSGGSGFDYKVLATRKRDANKPDFGLVDSSPATAALEVSDYTGSTPVSAVINGVEYDTPNLYPNADDAPDGALILNPNKST